MKITLKILIFYQKMLCIIIKYDVFYLDRDGRCLTAGQNGVSQRSLCHEVCSLYNMVFSY